MEKLIIRLFLDEDFDALNNTVRWNGKSRIMDETVAHHTYLATVFARVLLEDMLSIKQISPSKEVSATLLKLDITTKTLFHDFDETITGDLIHTVKYNPFNGEEIRKALDNFVSMALAEKFDLSSAPERMIYESVTTHIMFEKQMVKLCDWLSVLFYISKEMSLGNKRFRQNWNYAVECTKELASLLVKSQTAIEVLYSGMLMDFSSIKLLAEYDYEEILNNWK